MQNDIRQVEEAYDLKYPKTFDLKVLSLLRNQVAVIIARRKKCVFRVLGDDPLTELARVKEQASAVGCSNGRLEGVTPRSCSA